MPSDYTAKTRIFIKNFSKTIMKNMILIIGVTASGKGKVAFELAKQSGSEIISIDSMKVYRRMDIGTAKPPQEARSVIPYHLLDIIEPCESFSAGLFLKAANAAIKDIQKRGKPVIAVGGTALYIKALLQGLFEGPAADAQIRQELKTQIQNKGLQSLYQQLQEVDPAAASRISNNDAKRIIRAIEVFRITGQPISAFQNQWAIEKQTDHNWTIIGLRRDKEQESSRINLRVKKMIDAGLVDEVKSLLAENKPLSKQARCAIGYAEIIDYLQDRITLDGAVELIKKNTRFLAKHQRTWFRSFKNVNWLDIDKDESVENILKRAVALLSQLD
jgi:tRNA dimethylallyltransferase